MLQLGAHGLLAVQALNTDVTAYVHDAIVAEVDSKLAVLVLDF